MKSAMILSVLFLLLTLSISAEKLTDKQAALLNGARSCLGDVYDAGYYSGGPPPKGKGACTEVLYYAYKKIGIDLQDEIDRDIIANPGLYPWARDRNIDYRWCPNLIVWFKGFTKSLSIKVDKTTLQAWKPGDVVFWALTGDGVADHCGIVSDKKNKKGIPLAIHNFPPECTEDDVLQRWMIVGHFRHK